MGFCIGGPFIWNLLRRAPERIVAAVLAQPSGFRPELPDLFYNNNITGWGPALCVRRPEITMAMVDAFLNRMYRTDADFVFTVTRDFVRACPTPILVLPDDVPAHPYAVAMETARLAPNAEVEPLSVEGDAGTDRPSGRSCAHVPPRASAGASRSLARNDAKPCRRRNLHRLGSRSRSCSARRTRSS